MGKKELDPVTFEILEHRVEELVGEVYYTMTRLSGNPIIYECGDHQEALLDADGETVMIAGGILHWVNSLEMAGKHLLREYEENPGIHDGDQFMFTDCYAACVHSPDVLMLAPVFWEGKRVAWIVSAGHQGDVGGMAPGSMCSSATEVFQEGIQFPGVKIVENGIIRKDIIAAFQAMNRIPNLNMLDIHSKIGANHIGKARLLDMIERYGIDTVLTLFGQIKRYSEEKVRMRLREITDGSWKTITYVESIREEEPYLKVELNLTKENDSLTMDFNGSSQQWPEAKMCPE